MEVKIKPIVKPTTHYGNNNFNLENTFLIILKESCLKLDQDILNVTKFGIVTLVIGVLGIVIQSIFAMRNIILLLGVPMIILIMAMGLSTFVSIVQSPEKERLNRIIYDDYYITHKVNNEILLQDIASANQRRGEVSQFMHYEILMIISFLFIVCGSLIAQLISLAIN